MSFDDRLVTLEEHPQAHGEANRVRQDPQRAVYGISVPLGYAYPSCNILLRRLQQYAHIRTCVAFQAVIGAEEEAARDLNANKCLGGRVVGVQVRCW